MDCKILEANVEKVPTNAFVYNVDSLGIFRLENLHEVFLLVVNDTITSDGTKHLGLDNGSETRFIGRLVTEKYELIRPQIYVTIDETNVGHNRRFHSIQKKK